MTAAIDRIRRHLSLSLLGLAALGLAGCAGVPAPGAAPARGGGAQVAMLLPYGAGDPGAEEVARSIENAARLAAADLDGAAIDLRVYSTAGDPARAAEVARQAVREGADIIVGPLFSEAANAAGQAVSGSGISVLSFSNNAEIAGGNVFVLGYTYDDIARRVAGFAAAEGRTRMFVVHPDTPAGAVARDAAARAVAATGAAYVGSRAYPFSTEGLIESASGTAGAIRSSGSTAVILTDTPTGGLPLMAQMLRDNGVNAGESRFLGLTRWDIPAQTLTQPGLQGGLFARPDPAFLTPFQASYAQAFGAQPTALAPLGYDAIAAIGALTAAGGGGLDIASLTREAGFVGASGIFRLRPDGTNQRGLAVATIRDTQVDILDPAPRRFGGAGF
jgi:hypothetical protein